jgi:hypothetical protein
MTSRLSFFPFYCGRISGARALPRDGPVTSNGPRRRGENLARGACATSAGPTLVGAAGQCVKVTVSRAASPGTSLNDP